MDTQQATTNYFSKVIHRLQEQNFRITRNTKYKNQVYEYIAKRTRFEVEKYGFISTFFLFSRFAALDIHLLTEFSTRSFQYSKRGIHSPLGLFYGIVCFPVAIVDTVSPDIIEIMRKRAPPKHWAAFEMPIVYSLKDSNLYFCEITPTWGYLYYDHFRQVITATLATL